MTALARDPDRRYQSAAAMAEDLERHLRGDAVAARPPGRLARVWDRAAALPVRRSVLAAGAAVLIALVAASVWALSRPGAVVTPEEARAAARQLDRSVAFYLDGKRDSAAIAVAAARRHDRRNRTARVLEAHLGGGGNESARAGNSTYARALLAALQRYKANDPAGARAALASCGEEGSDASLVLAVRGICAEREGDHAAAEADLTAALRVLPSSVTMHRRLARVYERANRLEDAERLYRRCTELTPDSAAVWRDLARLHLNRRDLAAGYAAVERAIALASDGHGGGRDVATLRILVGLHIHSGRGEEARATLHEILRNEPDDVSSWHQLGYSFDMDHRIVEAVDAYNRVLALDPHHTGTLLNLANLHVGASRGQCRGCDEAYRAHPSYLDQAKAEGYLLRCLRENRGEAEWITHSARDVALRLHDRRAVMDLLVELTEGQEKTPAVLRLEDLLRRLRLVEGG
jgi:tetratricopeptide (TPR) repeat protein